MHLEEYPSLIAIVIFPEQRVLTEAASLVESFEDYAIRCRRQCQKQGAVLN